MRRISAFALTIIMIFSLCACGGEEEIKKTDVDVKEEKVATELDCPNFVGKTIEEVMGNKQNTDNFNLKQEWDYNADYEEGVVYKQSVSAGEKVKQTSEITLYISMGKSGKRVPDVYGLAENIAVEALETNGFTATVIEEASANVEKGLVIRTEPQRTEVVAERTEVKIFVSKGK